MRTASAVRAVIFVEIHMSSQPKLAWSLFALTVLIGSANAEPARELPSQFVDGRVYVTPTTHDGQQMRLYTDTGGGLFLKQAAVERLGLHTEAPSAAMQKEWGTNAPQMVRLPSFADGHGIPALLADDGHLAVMPDATAKRNELPGESTDDGMLGQAWFAGRIWTWDYPGERLRIESTGWRATDDMRRVPLGFQTDDDGNRNMDFPRINITVDGRMLPMLLDTGAMTVLTPDALAALADNVPAERSTSMIVDSVFQVWRTAHPEWRVVENAQAGTGSAMIEVPEVEIAGYRVGPVWFTHRPDSNFHDFMSSMMDQRVEGAIGGNALHHFVMTIDYPAAAAYFRCVEGCGELR